VSDEVKIDDMPVFVIKAKDRLAIDAIIDYRGLCTAHGLDEQAEQVQLAIDEIAVWQDANRHLVQLPDHPHVPASAPSEPVPDRPRVVLAIPAWPEDWKAFRDAQGFVWRLDEADDRWKRSTGAWTDDPLRMIFDHPYLAPLAEVVEEATP
jgi:hypothetical protein